MFRWNTYVLTIISLLLSFSVFAERCQSTLYSLENRDDYEHLRYAPKPVEILYDGKAFVASIDGEDDDDSTFTGGDAEGEFLAQPQWVAVHLKAYQKPDGTYGFAPGFKRPNSWYRDEVFSSTRQSAGTNKRLDDSYKGVGNTWNRGHLAQRADANRMGEQFGCNTHTFANAFPQSATFNQGIWLGLENYISGLANQLGELWVISGPVFTGTPDTIGDEDEVPVAVPQKVFKVVIWEVGDKPESLAFIYPNVPDAKDYKTGSCSRDKEYNHSEYFSSIAEIEDLTGLIFFNGNRIPLKQTRTTALPYVKKKYWVGDCR